MIDDLKQSLDWYLSLPNSEASQAAMAEGYQAERMALVRLLREVVGHALGLLGIPAP